MKKPPIYIFFDDVVREYTDSNNENSEEKMVNDLRTYFGNLSESSEIMLITYQDTSNLVDWLSKNEISQFVNKVLNPTDIEV